jgi:deoxyribodipyrimidine photolyase-related protein
VKNAEETKTRKMVTINLLFPHQLFEKSPVLENDFPVYLIEEYLFFRQYAFHKQKIAFHRASMKAYADFLQQNGKEVIYLESQESDSDIRKLIPSLKAKGIEKVIFINPTDNWLEKRLHQRMTENELHFTELENPLFLNTREDLQPFFRPDKKKFFQTKFYINERKKRNILLDEAGNALGGKWSFDAENRKKFPAKGIPPAITFPKSNEYYEEAKQYVNTNFPDNPGSLDDYPLYPVDFEGTQQWFRQFLEFRFDYFGHYEDAIVAENSILHHSVLTPLLNVGLISPAEVVNKALEHTSHSEVPLNSTEGFVRQIIGWREFIRGIYEVKGSEERTRNYWGFTRKIPASFYDGTTGILPIDQTIKKVLKTGYCHHIERLMILGNFMLLCEFDPDEVYRWFMELFIDAYDWVMVPNVYGMSQFADGGLMSTKPYISGSNYLKKMSNYPKGDWQQIWDALFWRFMDVHRDFFLKNPRLGMLVRTFDKMSEEKRSGLVKSATEYLEKLD